jgi:hypothetical protein
MIWLRATTKGSRNPDMLIVQLKVPGLVEPPTFYVDPSLVRGVPMPVSPGDGAEGQVMAFLVDKRADGKLIVQIPGEAVSYGPRLVVPGDLAA